MALVVEDGTGIADAESYRSVADIQTYAVKVGKTFGIADQPAAEAAARRAATWLDANYRSRLPGSRLKGRAQGLEWPRKSALDVYGEELPSDEVPPEWLAAHSEIAIRELASPGIMTPDVTIGKIKKSVSVAGAVSVTYADEGDVVSAQRPIVTLVDDLLGAILSSETSTGRSSVQFLSRA